jgi:LmbE family N-acetylglucosaminyl deacetylase
MKSIFISVALLVVAISTRAQTASMSSSQILQGIQKLNVVGSVLYIAAHPDDENTRLLGYLANHKKVKTTYLSLTRGDGGQNLIGKEQGIGLGLIRTNELLAARATDGAEQLFTRAYDFGYSKNPEETFELWNKDSILYDVVLAIRKVKPDVIICRFPTNGDGGHGHHTASALLAVDAIDAASDANIFPDQIKLYGVWKAKRLYWNAFVPSDAKEINPKHLTLDVGIYNTLMGKSYGELAAESRSCHKSQGFGSAALRGKHIEYFEYYKGDSASKDIFENIDWTWQRFGLQEVFEKEISNVIKSFDVLAPHKSVAGLISIYNKLSKQNNNDATFIFYKNEKLQELQKLILASSGLWLEATTAEYDVVANQNLNLNVQAITRYSELPITIDKLTSNLNIDTATKFTLLPNQLFTIKKKVVVPSAVSNSNPYWLNAPIVANKFTTTDLKMIGLPKAASAFQVLFDINILGTTFSVSRDVQHKYTDPVRGEVYRPLEVLPLATIQMQEPCVMFANNKQRQVRISIKSNSQSAIEGDLVLRELPNWKIECTSTHFKLDKRGDEATIFWNITPLKNAEAFAFPMTIKIDKQFIDKTLQRISYEHIPEQFILSEALLKLVPVDVTIKGNKIGYITGAGDDVAAALSQIGYKITTLTDEDISTKDLTQFDAIITGVRAYNTNEKLASYHQKLMAYVQQGGNMIVQYNTNSRAGPLKDKIGPYPFTISRERVTNEKATITALAQEHPALNSPNKIVEKDYENWIQERSIYCATEVDSHYVKILSMADKGDKATDGSLIITPYGKGNFVYTGIVFFRELPAGVPGAYRLMSNLISLPKHDK